MTPHKTLNAMVRMLVPIATIMAIPIPSAYAQERPSGPPVGVGQNIMDDNFVTLGVGAGVRPDFEGSDDYQFSPAPLLRGRVAGFDFAANGPGLDLDLLREKDRRATNLILGPTARVRFGRDNDVNDAVVARLNERKTALELGASAGVAINNVFGRFDTLRFTTNISFDVTGVHKGTLIRPSFGYGTPLGRATYVNLTVSATHADSNYMDTYFGVTAAESVTTSLPAFTARGGWKNIGTNAIIAHDLSGNALDGGWSVFLIGSYSRLLNDAKRSPIVMQRGNASQFFSGAGVAFTF